MKLTQTIKSTLLVLPVIVATTFALGVLGADARTQYSENGVGTTATPVFNEFYDVPNGVGDEADFVRIKPAAGTNADYVNAINDVCTGGATFTVRTYIHNGADPSFNEDTASAVARNTVVRMNAEKFSNPQSDFTFTSTISSSNAVPVTDSASLNCDDNVKLTLVPSSVQVYSKNIGVNSVSDNSVNGTLPIGSRTLNSGDVYACWDDRVIVYYEVIVERIPEIVEIPAVCDLLKLTVSTGRTVKIEDVQFSANDATVDSVVVNLGDGNTKTVAADGSEYPFTYTYDKAGAYKITATLNTTFKGETATVTSNNCMETIEIEEELTPIYACDLFTLTRNDRKVTVSFKATADNGATFKDASIVYTADGVKKNEELTNKVGTDGKVVSMYTFDKNATNVYAKATVRFNITNQDDSREMKEVTCQGKAVLSSTTTTTVPTTPSVLPNTGAGSTIIVMMTAVAGAGSLAHRKRTLARQ